MRIAYGDLWQFPRKPSDENGFDVRCITTNGTVEDGANIMGAGCAREAADRYPWLPAFYGKQIETFGNHVFLTGPVVMFPVKHQVWEPADLALIERSAKELTALAAIYEWTNVALPTPGCGHGALRWEDVEPVIAPILSAFVTIIRFPSEAPPLRPRVCTCGEHTLIESRTGRVTAKHLPDCPLSVAEPAQHAGDNRLGVPQR